MTVLPLTDVATCKADLSIDASDTSSDAYLQRKILEVGSKFEGLCERNFYAEERTALFRARRGQNSTVWLPAYPVVTVSSVKIDALGDFASASEIDSALWTVVPDTGQLILRLDFGVRGAATMQVVYTGGLATTAAGLLVVAPDLAEAATMQVCEEFRRRNNPGVKTRGGQRGGREWIGEHRVLPAVAETLAGYRSLGFGGS